MGLAPVPTDKGAPTHKRSHTAFITSTWTYTNNSAERRFHTSIIEGAKPRIRYSTVGGLVETRRASIPVFRYSRVEQLAARRAHNPEAAGSSPAPAPTTAEKAVHISHLGYPPVFCGTAATRSCGTTPTVTHRLFPSHQPHVGFSFLFSRPAPPPGASRRAPYRTVAQLVRVLD